MDALEAKSKKLGVLRGTLSRWILPYGNSNQSVSDQKSRAKEALENIPLDLRDRISDKEVRIESLISDPAG